MFNKNNKKFQSSKSRNKISFHLTFFSMLLLKNYFVESKQEVCFSTNDVFLLFLANAQWKMWKINTSITRENRWLWKIHEWRLKRARGIHAVWSTFELEFNFMSVHSLFRILLISLIDDHSKLRKFIAQVIFFLFYCTFEACDCSTMNE